MEPESRLLMSTEMMVQFPVSPPEAPTAAMTVPFWIITTAMMGMVTGQKSKIPADIRCQLPGFDKLYHYTDEGR